MSQTIKLTSKRQATFPAQLCRDLGVEAGDKLILERKQIGKKIEWVIIPQKKNRWFASLNQYAKGKKHDMESIRASIGASLKNTEK